MELKLMLNVRLKPPHLDFFSIFYIQHIQHYEISETCNFESKIEAPKLNSNIFPDNYSAANFSLEFKNKFTFYQFIGFVHA